MRIFQKYFLLGLILILVIVGVLVEIAMSKSSSSSLAIELLVDPPPSGPPWTWAAFKENGTAMSGNAVVSNDPNRVGFYLYPNHSDLHYKEALDYHNPDSIKRNPSIIKSLPFIFLVHGFMNTFRGHFTQTVKNAYLRAKFPGNIIAVDWGALARPTGTSAYLYYRLAANNVPIVARRLSNFIQRLIEHGIIPGGVDQIHIVGFSLGAQVAGVTGLELIQNGTGALHRITGLDPAGPRFAKLHRDHKLDSTDAQFVDVTHTNQGLKGYIGFLGHVDFFPNGGGPVQPGCNNLTDMTDILTGTCSHARAYQYFAESIRQTNITACKCLPGSSGSSSSPGGPSGNWSNGIEDMNFEEGGEEDPRVFINSYCVAHCAKPISFGQSCPRSARGIYYLKIGVPKDLDPDSVFENR